VLGSRFVKSPNIDRLAARHARTIVPTAGSRCAVRPGFAMTGLRPDTTRICDLRTDFRTNSPVSMP
jgi:hypothetical protein